MKELKNGSQVKINNCAKEWEQFGKPYYAEDNPIVNNRVVRAYENREILTVTNVRLNENGTYSCDLLTKENELLSGFYAWELKMA